VKTQNVPPDPIAGFYGPLRGRGGKERGGKETKGGKESGGMGGERAPTSFFTF